MDMQDGAVGIVGGVGPYAGLDLMRKILDLTEADRDQEHLPIIQYSLPHRIADRTAFLLGQTGENPGEVLGEIMAALARSGASVVGMPCNTAHSPAILDAALPKLTHCGRKVRFVHMIEETTRVIAETLPHARTIGVLSTVGTWKTGLYQEALAQKGLEALFPDKEGRENVQRAISDPAFGIKARSNPVTVEARTLLAEQAARLAEQGASAVILGCTEIPLALTENRLHGIPLIDATRVLAEALIRAFAPEKLKKNRGY